MNLDFSDWAFRELDASVKLENLMIKEHLHIFKFIQKVELISLF